MIILFVFAKFFLVWAGQGGLDLHKHHHTVPTLLLFFTNNCRCSKVSLSDCWSLPSIIENVKIWGPESTIAHVFFTIYTSYGLCVLRHSHKKTYPAGTCFEQTLLESYLSHGTAACSEPFATTVFPWRTRNIFHSLVPSESGRLNNFSWNHSGLG